MKLARTKWGMSIAGVVSVALLGCGRSRNGLGSTANSGGTTASSSAGGSAGAGTGGVSSGGTAGSGTIGGIGGGTVPTGTDRGGQDGTGSVVGSGGFTGSGGTMVAAGTGGAGSGGTGGRDAGPSDAPAGNHVLTTDGGAGAGGLGGGLFGSGGAATGGSTSPQTGIVSVDCSAAMPSGGTKHSENNSQGQVGNLTWSLWENGTGASMTSFPTAAFSASWGPNSGDVLARIGFAWGDSGKTYDQYGTITAQFAETKSGSAGGYSYIGVYGRTSYPCVEFYIVDDSYDAMPIKPYVSSNVGSAKIDGETYTFWVSAMTGTGGSGCATGWSQYHSVRQTARTCGQISVTEHFNAWRAAGMSLGSLVELEVLVEAGGGTGSIDFPVADVMIQ
jgi:endo-1,4-beta-xylanase